MAPDTLRNAVLQLAVSPEGAELRSITDQHGTEYLWQGDPLVWSGRSPILFPIVGKLAGDAYSHAGKTYTLPQHGFARLMLFSLVAHSNDSLHYSLRSDGCTRPAYPFEFDLTVSYRLEGNKVRVGYRVINLGHGPMPFSIGGHPGFSCAQHSGDVLEDYLLEFEKAETADTRLVSGGLIAVKERRRVLTGERLLSLTRTLFDANALVFMNLSSSAVTLRSRRHAAAVRVDFPGFPCLGIWSKPAAPFVCIEPWFGHADPLGTKPGSPLDTKPGIIMLRPGALFECEWRVTITTSHPASKLRTERATA
jgi:galactose mutarotase-like enzyme